MKNLEALDGMARRATLQLKVHGRGVVQSLSLDEADLACLIAALEALDPARMESRAAAGHRARLLDLLLQLRDRAG